MPSTFLLCSAGVCPTTSVDLEGNEGGFRVTGAGVGIPAKLMPRIFEPFVPQGKANGTGLVMAIAKSVVETRQGKITIASEVQRGTTVEIRFPTNARLR